MAALITATVAALMMMVANVAHTASSRAAVAARYSS